ncbi:Gar-IM [Lacticaseibacillus zeae]|uniref:Bacteriocin immunity protein n=2 Tax=Lacticaseibacillus zeae TaxID=57037 RepID=A0A5R8LPB4_LACZE|nr:MULTISPECIES: Gar-IM [Lacticaseibacillus]OFR98579.1 Gar-IM [Lactobacillus sp. HMSC068F07]MDE3316242.1 bacteriocin immunity protein [Lacticaseibacillus zeae]TLF39082.1 bacteriocin immunity protein [Lacticaseibacillus zeae]WLV83770.1 bacteriocin immunity protein [Lacticaseibacillus sp. NCIMB 15475]WLV86526.1 bacteriocin immunity protein [Lacticaseibacillus sp. NCIMB 15474]
MFKHNKKPDDKEKVLSAYYDFVLDPNITDRERKIGLLAKGDIERGRYFVAVLNQTLISFQREAMRTGLTKDASKFYDFLEPILNRNVPFGTNRGAYGTLSGYLD